MKMMTTMKATDVANPRDFPVFGMWSDHEDTANVDAYVRQLRKGRFAASAVESGTALMTGNNKHYKMIPELDLKTYRA